ncbi:MAG: GMC family oxidoreductase [Rhodocyclaceae bacterium]|nr:GMC family oxidoreductase [Rhodocyclaceae bacterium]
MNGPVPDVLIIGAGAGGCAMAWRLAELGVDALVLDAGPPFATTDFHADVADWEDHLFPERPGSQGRCTAQLDRLDPSWDGLRSWSRNYGPQAPGDQRRFAAYQHVRGLGGSTLHFTAESHRLHPAAMALRSRFGVAVDWPFDYAALAPHYEAAERQLGTAGSPADRSRPRGGDFPLPPHRPSYASQRLMAATEPLALGWVPNPVAIPSQAYGGRPPCIYCGQCHRGCQVGDKGSFDRVFLAPAVASGRCSVRHGLRVLRIEAEGERVRRVVCRDARNVDVVLEARVVVLAAGAIESPRLLLNSAAAHSPEGLCNESGQVGRHFMETVSTVLSGLHPEPLGSMRGLPADIISWRYNAPDAIPGLVGGCRFTPATATAELAGPVNHARRMLESWGDALIADLRRTYGSAFALGAIGESLPHDKAFVALDATERDADGLPLARIHAGHEASTPARLKFMLDKSREILAAFGITDIREQITSYDLFNATHVFGTCRMGADPARSVVDAGGRSHRWPNLFVADASVFPTSGGGEAPTLTIAAIAHRSAGIVRDALARRDI